MSSFLGQVALVSIGYTISVVAINVAMWGGGSSWRWGWYDKDKQ